MRKYFLYVGNAYPHKNLERLVVAFGALKNPGLDLVLVGGDDFFYERLRGFVRDKNIENVVFAGYVQDEDLEVFYKNATFYVFPSLYEGFGLPPLEALSKFVPVISSKSSCMPEILGDLAIYFDPEKKENIQFVLDRAVKNKEKLKLNKKRTVKRMRHFSWEKAAKETLDIYKILLERTNVKK